MEERKCPRCGKYNLNYKALEMGDNAVYYPWTCTNCGASGKEWYELPFCEQKIID